MTLVPPTDLQCLRLQLQPVVLGLQVLDAVLGLAQLGLQLSLQLPASLLELQQLLLGLLAAAVVTGGRVQLMKMRELSEDCAGGRDWTGLIL